MEKAMNWEEAAKETVQNLVRLIKVEMVNHPGTSFRRYRS